MAAPDSEQQIAGLKAPTTAFRPIRPVQIITEICCMALDDTRG